MGTEGSASGAQQAKAVAPQALRGGAAMQQPWPTSTVISLMVAFLAVLCLAGYGFSSAAKERGCGVTAMAGIMDSLMASLGYSRYIAQVGSVLSIGL